MNTRKANLKKLRLPSTQASSSRIFRRATSTISHFFSHETDASKESEDDGERYQCSEPMPSPIEYSSPLPALDATPTTTPPQITCSLPMPSPISKLNIEPESKPIRSVRTKLKTFLPKEKRMKPAVEKPISDFLTARKSNDFEIPAKTTKTAPKTKTKSRSKKQQTIKSAFLKNEELFSEVTAQHCLVENINPEEMQMALALSISEAETGGTAQEVKRKDDNDNIRDKLKKFGFQVAQSEEYELTAYTSKKGKTKWANKFTSLTLRNPKRQLEKVNQKIEEIIKTQFIQCEPLNTDENLRVSVHSNVLLPLVAVDQIVQSDSSGRPDVVDFYVLSLFEPSNTKAGYLLKDVHRIPGRDRSPSKTNISSNEKLVNIDVTDFQLQSPSIKKSRVVGADINLDAKEHITFSQNENLSQTKPADDRRRKTPALCNSEVECSGIVKSSFFNNCSQEFSIKSIESTGVIRQISMNGTGKTKTHETSPNTMTNGAPSQFLSKSTRATSPDIFADSDVEMETDNEMEQSKLTSSSCNIETFEIFSSDEAKTFTDAKGNQCLESDDLLKAVIDLTQIESDTNSQNSEPLIIPSMPIQSYQELDELSSTSFHRIEDELERTLLNSQVEETNSISLSNFKEAEFSFIYNTNQHLENSKKNSCFSFGSSASEEIHKSKTEENSIDLTQSNSDDEDCIVLSDDEVNYSMWKAETSLHVKEEKSFIYESPESGSKEEREFSFVDLVASSQPLGIPSEELELIDKPSISADELDMDLSKRSDFGILDEQSPFKTPTKTPMKTPRKTPSKTQTSPTVSRCRRALSESFLGSPMESSAPLKRFSSSNKFQEFTKSEEESFSALDDIDKLIFGSPSKKAYKKPTGLTQLLTGAISTKIVSPVKTQHSEEELPQEFNFNGRTYLVRTVNVSQRPNFETMDESALLDQLYRYGIKPLKRKQAVKLLEYVYNQTHPCLVDETDIQIPTAQSQSNAQNILDDDDVGPIGDIAVSESKFNLKDCWGDILVSETIPSLEIEDEQFIVQTNTSKKISTAFLPFHIAWYNLVKSNKQLHEAILHYEPIDLQEVHLFFKGLGYRYDPKAMKYFFDSRSIVFRYDLKKSDPTPGAGRHVRKKKK